MVKVSQQPASLCLVPGALAKLPTAAHLLFLMTESLQSQRRLWNQPYERDHRDLKFTAQRKWSVSSVPPRGGWGSGEGQGKKRSRGAQSAQVQSWRRPDNNLIYHFGVIFKVYLGFSSRFFKMSLSKQTFIIYCFALLFYLGIWDTNKEIKIWYKPYSLSGWEFENICDASWIQLNNIQDCIQYVP